jgi:hypothetical protein
VGSRLALLSYLWKNLQDIWKCEQAFCFSLDRAVLLNTRASHATKECAVEGFHPVVGILTNREFVFVRQVCGGLHLEFKTALCDVFAVEIVKSSCANVLVKLTWAVLH